MKSLRYYAIGHSYLKHGPFVGWQTDGFWGMAASKPENDYFHKFQDGLKTAFNCKIEAIAENHADYERLCTTDATPEKYRSSGGYARMKEVIERFKPNVISVFVGGGNTPANDEKSLTLFFEVLYELIAKHKREDTVVLCIMKNPSQHAYSRAVADKYGFISVDVSFIHANPRRDNPYYAFADYPEYDERRAMGAVEFRTHPGDKGHEAIAEEMLKCASAAIAVLPEGKFDEEYEYEKYTVPGNPSWFSIKTAPKMRVFYFGFNLRQVGDAVVFGSAPGTGASLLAEKAREALLGNTLSFELRVDGAGEDDVLNIELIGSTATAKLSLPIVPDMHVYEAAIPEGLGEISALRIVPSANECVLSVKAIEIKN